MDHPKGLCGWLRLDYSVNGTPPLREENGEAIVRMPPGGRTQTSSAPNGSIDQNEYPEAADRGFRRLEFSQRRMARGEAPIQEYAVQERFRISHGDQRHYEAVGKVLVRRNALRLRGQSAGLPDVDDGRVSACGVQKTRNFG